MDTKLEWCWYHRSTLQLIRDNVPDIASGLVVYVALTELLVECKSNPFQATQNAIAIRCGLSVRTVRNRLAELESIGVIRRIDLDGPRQAYEFELLNPNGNRRNNFPPPSRDREGNNKPIAQHE
jgi:hypothetical protein